MNKRLTVSAVVLGFFIALPAQANNACFTPDEAKAAHFRTMLQEFNVAALNCQSTDPSDTAPSIRDRYNMFVSKHGSKLQQNAVAVRAHFSRAGGNLDNWMTKVANSDGQRVMTEADFCQRTSDNLDKALELQAHELEGYASTAMVMDPYVDECPSKAVVASVKKDGTVKKHHKKTKPEKTADAG